ncbi:MAG: hypothetical protein PUB67_00565 [Clostridiales bacterium]|nr:hypothetical protein [Clostridiales bacterium]
MNELYISVRNLTKSFGKRKVVDDLSFDVHKGEFFSACLFIEIHLLKNGWIYFIIYRV